MSQDKTPAIPRQTAIPTNTIKASPSASGPPRQTPNPTVPAKNSPPRQVANPTLTEKRGL